MNRSPLHILDAHCDDTNVLPVIVLFRATLNVTMASKDDSDVGQTTTTTEKKQSRFGKKLSRAGILSGGSFRLPERKSPLHESTKSPTLTSTSASLSIATLPRISLTSSTGNRD